MVSFILSIIALVLGYILYGKFVEKKFGVNPDKDTPAISKADGVDFVPMGWGKIFLIQFLNIAGLGPIFGTPFKGTAEAVSEKNVLNERVREKFVNQYSGRPSVYINQRIDALLPQGQFVDESVAASKYEDVKKVLQEGLTEMEAKLNSKIYKGTELIEVQNQYKSIQSLVSDLDVAINSLRKSKPKKVSLEAGQV